MPNLQESNEYIHNMTKKAHKNLLRVYAKQEIDFIDIYSEAAKDLIKKYKSTKSLTNANLKARINELYVEAMRIIDKNGLEAGRLAEEVHQFIGKEMAGGNARVDYIFNKLFTNINKEAIAVIKAGGIYKDNKGLSARIWNSSKQWGKDVQQIVLEGMARQESAKEMAQRLEHLVDPKVRKSMSKKTLDRLGYSNYKNIEYNALRVARTTINHAFQLTTIQSARRNPYTNYLRWHSVMSPGRTCSVCEDRDGQLYTLDNVPLDHPNGLCYQTAELQKSLDTITDELIDWANGNPNSQLDSWYKKYGELLENSA